MDTINLNAVTSWPQAIVAVAAIIAVACVVIAFWIAITGSKFPWER